jgi:endonuclease/exonuclease/phosphatase family metal-dependent hydrolase
MREPEHADAVASDEGTREARFALSLKILTLNIHKGFTIFNRRFVLHELRDAVRDISADLVFLQEVVGSHAEHAARHPNWPTDPHYQFVAESIWGNVAYGRNAVYTEGHHGNAVLSKCPLVSHDNYDISVGFKDEKRGLLHCIVKMPGGNEDMHAICVHFSLREAHRHNQLHRLCDLVRTVVPATAPLVVAGDFNDWRMRAGPILESNLGLKEAFTELTGAPAKSFPARWPLLRLDRIYVRNACVRRTYVHYLRPWSHLSDHAALFAEIEL